MPSLEQKCKELKAQVKQWEHQFRNENGRDPDRDDIRQHSEMKLKYKKYHQYKELLQLPPEELRRKLKGGRDGREKREKHAEVEVEKGRRASNGSEPPESQEPQEPPEAQEQPDGRSTPEVSDDEITELGPTPQLQGRVIGLFDFNSPGTPQIAGKPSKRRRDTRRESSQFDTPSKRRTVDVEDSISSPSKPSRSPGLAPAPAPGLSLTPTKSPSKLVLPRTPASATPSYLRFRSHVVSSPVKSKGLSSLIAELKQIQDEGSLEEEFEEIIKIPEGSLAEEQLDEEIRQLEGQLNPEQGEGRREWKKKGQKRTTKRHKFKPVLNEQDIENGAEIPKVRQTKQTENFVRLKLNNSGYKGYKPRFGRRAR